MIEGAWTDLGKSVADVNAEFGVSRFSGGLEQDASVYQRKLGFAAATDDNGGPRPISLIGSFL